MKVRHEPMFLNPVIRAKTYIVHGRYGAIGEVNADTSAEAISQAKALFGNKVRAVFIKHFKPSCET